MYYFFAEPGDHVLPEKNAQKKLGLIFPLALFERSFFFPVLRKESRRDCRDEAF